MDSNPLKKVKVEVKKEEIVEEKDTGDEIDATNKCKNEAKKPKSANRIAYMKIQRAKQQRMRRLRERLSLLNGGCIVPDTPNIIARYTPQNPECPIPQNITPRVPPMSPPAENIIPRVPRMCPPAQNIIPRVPRMFPPAQNIIPRVPRMFPPAHNNVLAPRPPFPPRHFMRHPAHRGRFPGPMRYHRPPHPYFLPPMFDPCRPPPRTRFMGPPPMGPPYDFFRFPPPPIVMGQQVNSGSNVNITTNDHTGPISPSLKDSPSPNTQPQQNNHGDNVSGQEQRGENEENKRKLKCVPLRVLTNPKEICINIKKELEINQNTPLNTKSCDSVITKNDETLSLNNNNKAKRKELDSNPLKIVKVEVKEEEGLPAIVSSSQKTVATSGPSMGEPSTGTLKEGPSAIVSLSQKTVATSGPSTGEPSTGTQSPSALPDVGYLLKELHLLRQGVNTLTTILESSLKGNQALSNNVLPQL